MIHSKRKFTRRTLPSFAELGAFITKSPSWVLCQGFAVEVEPGTSWVLLNDSSTEDSIAEFCVLLETGDAISQVESFTIGWMDAAGISADMQALEDQRQAGTLKAYRHTPIAWHDEQQTCELCA